MTADLRVVADVTADGDAWTVRLRCPAEPTWAWPANGEPAHPIRAKRSRSGRLVPLADSGWCAGGADHRLCCAADGDSVAAAVAAVAARARGGDGVALGRLLFVVLFGVDAKGWKAVQEVADLHPGSAVELALRWTARDGDLTGLPWELLHDGDRFLATSRGGNPVAVTRVLAGTRGASPPMLVPPRVLFVVGTAVSDERVRPGAEIVGLLRAVRQSGVRIHHRLLYDASPDRLHAAMETFKPHVVHLIAHGGVGPRGPYVVLRSDDTNRPEEQRYAQQFAEQLTIGGRKPPVVVLSACETGALHLPGPGMATPFAVELVAAGVPVVAAMAGMVTDRACRLFTRRFGQALAAGLSIVGATAEARRLTFAGDSAATLDWALPAVFLADEDEPLRVERDDERATLIAGWVDHYGLDVEPVFCGREEILSAFIPLLPPADGARTGWESRQDRTRRAVLAICSDEAVSGVGKTRLLQELARQALMDGHLPVLVGIGGSRPAPQSLDRLCLEVAGGIAIVRDDIGLPPDELTQCDVLGDLLRTGADTDDSGLLDQTARRFLRLGQPERAVRAALSADLGRLVDEARQRWPHLRAGPGRVVLLLDNLGRAAQPVLSALLDGILGAYGLGDRNEPVPVVLMVQAREVTADIRQGRYARLAWLETVDLEPLSASGGEDLFAYEQVMLHPFLGRKKPGITDVAWVFNRAFDEAMSENYAQEWRDLMAGLPIRFTDGPYFPSAIGFSQVAGFVVPAEDEDVTVTRP